MNFINEKRYASCHWSHPNANGRAINFDHLGRRKRTGDAPLEMPLDVILAQNQPVHGVKIYGPFMDRARFNIQINW
jgi:hypothetical protein